MKKDVLESTHRVVRLEARLPFWRATCPCCSLTNACKNKTYRRGRHRAKQLLRREIS